MIEIVFSKYKEEIFALKNKKCSERLQNLKINESKENLVGKFSP